MELLRTRLEITDVEQSLDFFRDKLGLVEVGRTEEDREQSLLILLAAPEEVERARENQAPLLELAWQPRPEGGASAVVPAHIAYQVEDLYWLCNYLLGQGVVLERPPRDGRWARVRSPDGHVVDLRQQGNPREPMEPWVDMADAPPGPSRQAAPEDAAIC